MDVARFLLGEDCVRVSVRSARAPSKAPARRPLLFIFETTSGVLIHVEIYADAGYGYDVRAELVLEDAVFAVGEPVSSTFRHHRVAGHQIDADWSRRFEAAYRRQAEAWIHSIENGLPAGASAWDGYVVTRMADECVDALNDGIERQLTLEPAPSFYNTV